jgi:hypothetical protein
MEIETVHEQAIADMVLHVWNGTDDTVTFTEQLQYLAETLKPEYWAFLIGYVAGEYGIEIA